MESADAALSSSLTVHVGPDNIRSLILEKEKELHDINEYRIRTLETLLRDKETAANAAKQTLIKLQEDFMHKLKLLERRNEELALNDVIFTSLKNVLRDKEMELNEVQAREKKIQIKLNRVKEQRDELKIQYQQKLRYVRAQVKSAKWKFEDKLKHQQRVMEISSRKVKKLLREKEKEVKSQRREWTMTFDDVMRQKEMAFERENKELQMKMKALEMKNEMMVQNTDVQCTRVEELKTKNEKLERMIQEKDKEITFLKLTVTDVKTTKEAKVGELESEVVKLTEMKQQLTSEYESKIAELSLLLSSVEKSFVQQKTQHDEELRSLLERKQSDMQEASARSEAMLKALILRLRESEEKVEALQAELMYAKKNADDKIIDMEREIKRVRSALQELEERAQTLQKISQESASQIALLKEKDMTLRQELMESIEKQKDLQREVVAVNLEWENRWQEQQQQLDEQHELHLRELQHGRDEKQAIEERLLYAEDEVQWLRSELLSLKVSAGITDSFDTQCLASAANLAAKMSSEYAPAVRSSLWSDDPGTLSSGVSLLLTESPLLQPTTTADTYVNALETDSAKLRELIQQMKESLTQQEEEMEVISEQAGESHSASKRAEQLVETQKRDLAIETQLDKNSSSGSSIALQFESCKQELIEAQQSVETKSRQIVELESRIQELEVMRTAESQLQSRHAVLEAQIMDLNRKLGAANCDIERLVRQRCQLMKLSNQLRADLRRSGSSTGSRSLISRVEFAGKKDYQNLIAELTQSLKDVRVRNKALKKHLRRMVKLQIRLQHKRMSVA
ncbi:unnamed protein product [Peronospora effusa]|nr:unnamed protein product [Peronospora effusa]